MKRIEILKKASEFRHKLGDINRQLAFAGIAIIWIFKVKNGDEYSMSHDLMISVRYIIIALGIDLIHYIWLTSLYVFVNWFYDEKKKLDPEEDVQFGKFIPRISDLMILSKVFFNILGYCKILSFLKNTIQII